MDINNDFYMVKFNLEEDMSRCNHGTPDFVAPTTTIDKTMVWIRFLGINLVFYDESSLLALAAMVGSPFKVDANTLDVKRGRFSHANKHVIGKHVIGKMWLLDHWYKVE
ncbi:hypothetical protein GmHk_04G010556 [Glycine max]|nr:hypothetical protein GmHk_04G010556 [Glycine max]